MNEKQDRNLHLVMQRIRKKKTKGAQISVRYSNRGDFVFELLELLLFSRLRC